MKTLLSIVEAGKILYQKGLVAGNAGNMSVRVEEGFLITASGSCLGRLTEEDIVLVDKKGRIKGKRPSVETPLHQMIYKQREDVGAIIHTHSPFAIVAGLRGRADFSRAWPEGEFEVALVPFFPPGSEDLARNVAEKLRKVNCALLAKHGAVTVGGNIWEALYRAEILEQLAKVVCLMEIWRNEG